MAARPAQSRRFCGFLKMRTLTIAAAASANAASSGVCQPAACDRKLKAAPLLNTSTRLKNAVISSRCGRLAKCARISHFESWSAATTAAPSANHRVLDMQPRLAGAAQVALAASAQAGGVDVGAVVPAAPAFG